MNDYDPSKDQLIPPLTRKLLPRVPWFLRWCGWLNNRWNESVVDAFLATRDDSTVMEAWKAVLPDDNLVERILGAIGDEMGWENPRFIPQDECFVVIKLWWHGIADNLERETCLLSLERVCEKSLPSSVLPMLIEMNLGDLLGQFRSGGTSLKGR